MASDGQDEREFRYDLPIDGGRPVWVREGEWKHVAPILAWLRAPLDIEIDPAARTSEGAFRVGSVLAEALGFQVRLFHALHSPSEALSKKPFEFALEIAAREAGFDASIAESATTPGADIVMNGQGFSVKTEAGRTTSRQMVFLTKLMESAWTKNLNSPQHFLFGLQNDVLPRVLQADRTLLWRCHGRLSGAAGVVEYELLEIPRTFWEALTSVQASDFSPITKAGSTSAPVSIGGEQIYTISFDGSDQKVQVRNLAVNRCVFHGRWRLRPPPTESR
jgi:hypothetical protein